ncbi:peroxide stress protein YaaA [Microbacterium sp. NIBRBAC000506063]|nr:peroxide stress protein YaaA [Microbacterium sp. NIBRBAC000506063]QTV79516.1 peroxide stress protein YaaA [Microbacterium sp. NIBRBAC000506063]
MRVLLPPSETKRTGGSGQALDPLSLSLPSLAAQREQTVDALVALSADPAQAQRTLKLSARQLGEIEHNRMLRSAPTMPAVDRYTGVLFDALDAATLETPARRWLGRHAWIHSAPFGPVGALDAIPAYRLAAGTSLPGLAPLRRHWSDAVTAAFAAEAPGFILDLRSEAYVELGPIPASVPSVYVRVVADEGGSTRALNHFNKKAKGLLVRALAEDRPTIRSQRALERWAATRGIVIRSGADAGVIELVAEA